MFHHSFAASSPPPPCSARRSRFSSQILSVSLRVLGFRSCSYFYPNGVSRCTIICELFFRLVFRTLFHALLHPLHLSFAINDISNHFSYKFFIARRKRGAGRRGELSIRIERTMDSCSRTVLHLLATISSHRFSFSNCLSFLLPLRLYLFSLTLLSQPLAAPRKAARTCCLDEMCYFRIGTAEQGLTQLRDNLGDILSPSARWSSQ